MPKKTDWRTHWLKESSRQGPWDWKDWQLYLHAEDKGVAKPTFKSKVKEMSKTGVNGSHAFSAKVYEPCTANLFCHETPTPCSFLPPSPVPGPEPTSRIFNHKVTLQARVSPSGWPCCLFLCAGMLIGHFGPKSMDGIYFTCDTGSLWGLIELCGQLFLMRHGTLSWVFSSMLSGCAIQYITCFTEYVFLFEPPDTE